MSDVPKRGRGRPRGLTYGEPTQVRLTPEQKAHLKHKYRTVSEGVRKLVTMSMMRESISNQELPPEDRKYLIKEYGSVAAGLRKLIDRDKKGTDF